VKCAHFIPAAWDEKVQGTAYWMIRQQTNSRSVKSRTG